MASTVLMLSKNNRHRIGIRRKLNEKIRLGIELTDSEKALIEGEV